MTKTSPTSPEPKQSNEAEFKFPTAAPGALAVHPALKDLPEWSDDDPQFEALCLDISARGIDYPLKVTPNGLIVDGRHRWRAAKKLNLSAVPVSTVTEAEVLSVVVQSLLQRRHYTKGALAYMLVPLCATGPQQGFSQDALAHQGNVSRQIVQQALTVHEIFTKSGPEGAEYKAEQEPKILSGETGLGAVIAGWAGREATKGKQKNATTQLALWDRSFTDLTKRLSAWEKFDASAQMSALSRVATFAEAMPDTLLHQFAKKLSTELKRREKESQ